MYQRTLRAGQSCMQAVDSFFNISRSCWFGLRPKLFIVGVGDILTQHLFTRRLLPKPGRLAPVHTLPVHDTKERSPSSFRLKKQKADNKNLFPSLRIHPSDPSWRLTGR
jgi:hypothetical protein